MGQDLEFSIMADTAAGIQPLLNEFEAQHHIHVRLRLLTWDTAWSDLLKVALYGDGPDISEIGTTWLGDMVAMNALRPFAEQEIAELGRASAFLPSAWQGVRLVSSPVVWAIPWFTGARLLFYRRNLFERAEVDEHTAFQTAEQLDQAVGQLHDSGVKVPWTIPTDVTHTTLLNVASWVWGVGGDFVAPDGKRTLFSQPAARAGFRAYFALGRFLASSVRHLSGLQPDNQFVDDPETAMTISGSWLFRRITPEAAGDVGMALPPGASFVGGSDLVIWKHSLKEEAALKLIQFLTGTPAQVAYCQHIGLLPTQLAALGAAPFATDPLWQKVIQGVKTGRSFSVIRSWGLMEDRLTRALNALWKEVLSNPDLDLDAAIARQLEPLATRLDLVLGHA